MTYVLNIIYIITRFLETIKNTPFLVPEILHRYALDRIHFLKVVVRREYYKENFRLRKTWYVNNFYEQNPFTNY